ncbi:MAG: hypothetical protein KAR20_22795 [Candidatus Heimdallarchaeota archaeon]|nr:hypothetical protein [Candidatus Heimdallarchaeota archaeon]
MAIGSFFLAIEDAKVIRKGLYLNAEIGTEVLGENEILRIRLRHADKRFVLTLLSDFQIYSLMKIVEIKRKSMQIIVGVILAKDINSVIHKNALEMLMEKIIPLKMEPNEKLTTFLHENFSEYFERPEFILDKKEIEKRLSGRVKILNKAGKFDEANKFLDKIKKIPKKLYRAHNSAENAMQHNDFEKSIKDFQTAQKFAAELEEFELVGMYKAKIQLARKTPALLKKREDLVERALNGLRSDQFSKAQHNFKKAAEVSEELLDSRHSEEYALKAQALAEFIKIDKKFKKR